MSEVVIMSNKSSQLLKDRFIFKNQTYLISDMELAKVLSGFLQPAEMEIQFKNGEKKQFNVGTVSNTSTLNALFSGFLVDTMGQDLKVSVQQWVTAINMLIALSK